jgi:hypothetical protein
MPLRELLLFMINRVSKTTSVELFNFFNHRSPNKLITKQALSKAREHLSPDVFIKLNEIYVNTFYEYENECEVHKGYIVLAMDGTGLNIPNTKEIQEYFGFSTNQMGRSRNPVANCSIMYDIMNGIIVNGVISPYRVREKAMAEEQIRFIKSLSELKKKKIIILFDRIYSSVKLMSLLRENNIDFIMRSRVSYNNETKKAAISTTYDKTRVIKLERYVYNKNPWLDKILKKWNYHIDMRICTGKFSDNETGVFITSLNRNEFKREEIVELYRNRWKIETQFRYMKETGEFENFACKRVNLVLQEFFCRIYTLNMCTLMVADAQNKLDEDIKSGKVKTKHKLRINENVAYGLMKDHLIECLHDNDEYYKRLVNEIYKHRIAVIPGRKFERPERYRRAKHNVINRRAG